MYPEIKPEENVCQEINSHKNLDEIFNILWSAESPLKDMVPRGSFSDLVFRLVLFHQSLEGISRYPNMVNLTEQEQEKFCDPKFYKLMLVLMINDSSSYTFIGRTDEDVANEKEFL